MLTALTEIVLLVHLLVLLGKFILTDDLPTNPLIPDLEETGIFSGTYDDEDVGPEADLNNLEITMNVSPIPITRIHMDHPKDQIIGDINSATQTRRMTKISEEHAMMSSIGELTFFLGLQVQQKEDGIFISQDKYMTDILKKFDFITVKTASTLIQTNKALLKDEEAEDVDAHLYRSMIRSLMYLIAFRPDIMFVVCACASDYAGASLDRKSTTGGCQFLGKRLISWQCKKQTIVANSTIEAEYVVAANCCGQNPVFHSKTKHIEIRHHFIRDSYEKKLIQVIKIYTDHNVTDLLTKAFDVSRFNFLIASIRLLRFSAAERNQDKYVADILKKFDFSSVKTASTPIETNKELLKSEEAKDVDVHLYILMIRSLMMYLIAFRPNIMFDVCACASDYAGASLDRKSTIGGCQFLGKRLISWQCKKQTVVANSTTEAEYVVAANCCGQDSYEKRLIQVIKIHTDHNVVDLLTKAFDVSSDEFGVKTGSCKINAARQDLVLVGES
ncbi:hypothetical protein Tco_0294192 [Tanacetum coccineum]